MGGNVPPELARHKLAELWHCRPSEVDEEDENDQALAIVKHNTDQRFQQFNAPKPPS